MKKFISYVVRPGTGRSVPQAAINVKSHPSTIESPNASVFSDYDGLLPIPQPFLSDDLGIFQFYAPDGRYDVYMSVPDPDLGTIVGKWSDVSIFDPTSGSQAASAIESSGFITFKSEGALSSEIVIPTFIGHPDSPPSSPNPFDNEFSAINENWVNFNTNSDSTLVITNGRLRLGQENSTRTNPCFGLQRAITTPPSGTFTVTALVRLGYNSGPSGVEMSSERPMIGIGLRSSLGEIATIGPRGGSQGISVFTSEYDSSSLLNADGHQQLGTNACYVRVRVVSSVAHFEWSADGFGWVTVKVIALSSLFGGSVVQYGIYGYAPFSTDGSFTSYADFIRFQQ
jgi:hypothetical protein